MPILSQRTMEQGNNYNHAANVQDLLPTMYPLLCGLMGPENGPRGDAMRIHPIATVYFGVILLCLSKGPFTNP